MSRLVIGWLRSAHSERGDAAELPVVCWRCRCGRSTTRRPCRVAVAVRAQGPAVLIGLAIFAGTECFFTAPRIVGSQMLRYHPLNEFSLRTLSARKGDAV